jgi:hypothetical protein
MNNFAIDNNIFIFRPSNQKIQPIFHYNSFDLESNIENYDSGFEKRFLFNLYKLNHEKDLYGAKIMQETNQKKLDIIDEINHSSNAITNNVNNNFFLFEDLIPFYNMENDNYFSKNKDIFKIVKINKKIGRIKKNSTVKRIHNKLSQDNIIRKIKGRFHEKLRLYNNEEYKKYLFKKTGKKKKLINWMKRISPKVSRRIKKEDNLKWFESKVFEIFSEKVSLKYSLNNFD